MQNKTNQGQKVVSPVLNRVAKWAIFVLDRVRVWSPLRHSSTQNSLECPPGIKCKFLIPNERPSLQRCLFEIYKAQSGSFLFFLFFFYVRHVIFHSNLSKPFVFSEHDYCLLRVSAGNSVRHSFYQQGRRPLYSIIQLLLGNTAVKHLPTFFSLLKCCCCLSLMSYFYAPVAPERASYWKKQYEIVEAYWLIGISLLPIKRADRNYYCQSNEVC